MTGRNAICDSDAKAIILNTFLYFSWVGVSTIGIQLCLYYTGLMDSWSLKNNFLFGFPVCLFYMFSTSCMMLIALIYFTIKTWNELVLRFLSNDDDEDYVKFGVNLSNSQLIQLCSKFHLTIWDTMNQFSTSFRLNILVFLLQFFYMSLMTLFNLLSLIISQNSTLFFFVLLVGLWFLQYLPFVFWMTSYSSAIEDEGATLDDSIERLLKSSDRLGGIEKRVNAIHIHNQNQNLVLCCVYFKLDWYLIFSTLCAIMNYFIILIQMYDA